MRRTLVIITILAGTAGLMADDSVVRVKLRPGVTVYGQAVTLADVLSMRGASPELSGAIADKPLRVDTADAARFVVTHEEILERLEALGVNLARVLVGGASQCVVTVRPKTQPGGDVVLASDEQPAPLIRTKQADASGAGSTTLADILRQHINREMTSLGGEGEVHFERAGAEFLKLTSPPFEFNISSSGRGDLGLREFRVVVRRDGRTQRTVHVYARVRLIRKVAVAARPLSIGNFIKRDDVVLETRVFDDGDDIGIGQAGEVIGQQVKEFVAAGELVRQRDLKPVDLVSRSRPVTVLGGGDSIAVRLTGVALDSGGYGDTVRVRMGDSRGDRRVLRGVVTGLGTVRLSEGNI